MKKQNSQETQDVIDELNAISAWIQTYGSYIQAIGQTKFLSKKEEDKKEGIELQIKGNLIQALGNSIQAALAQIQGKSEKDKKGAALDVLGPLFQSIGNVIEAAEESD